MPGLINNYLDPNSDMDSSDPQLRRHSQPLAPLTNGVTPINGTHHNMNGFGGINGIVGMDGRPQISSATTDWDVAPLALSQHTHPNGRIHSLEDPRPEEGNDETLRDPGGPEERRPRTSTSGTIQNSAVSTPRVIAVRAPYLNGVSSQTNGFPRTDVLQSGQITWPPGTPTLESATPVPIPTRSLPDLDRFSTTPTPASSPTDHPYRANEPSNIELVQMWWSALLQRETTVTQRMLELQERESALGARRHALLDRERRNQLLEQDIQTRLGQLATQTEALQVHGDVLSQRVEQSRLESQHQIQTGQSLMQWEQRLMRREHDLSKLVNEVSQTMDEQGGDRQQRERQRERLQAISRGGILGRPAEAGVNRSGQAGEVSQQSNDVTPGSEPADSEQPEIRTFKMEPSQDATNSQQHQSDASINEPTQESTNSQNLKTEIHTEESSKEPEDPQPVDADMLVNGEEQIDT